MGKIVKTKAHRGTHRSAGAFHSSEVNAASAMAMELEDMMPAASKPARQSHGDATHGGADDGVGAGAVRAVPEPPMSRGQRKRFARKSSVKNKFLLETKLRGKQIKLKEGALGEMGTLELSLPAPPPTKARLHQVSHSIPAVASIASFLTVCSTRKDVAVA